MKTKIIELVIIFLTWTAVVVGGIFMVKMGRFIW